MSPACGMRPTEPLRPYSPAWAAGIRCRNLTLVLFGVLSAVGAYNGTADVRPEPQRAAVQGDQRALPATATTRCEGCRDETMAHSE